MSLIIRIDVDRPYGKHGALRHVLSRLSSDLYFPTVESFGFLAELQTMLSWLNEAKVRAYVFFRRCTLPSELTLQLLDAGHHEIGLHLEDSRSFDTFQEELRIVEEHCGRKVQSLSKHGSGAAKFGFHHYAPYEPEKYIEWARRSSMKVFLGNLEDPSIDQVTAGDALLVFPSAFWLEPAWRDANKFTVEWLMERARHRDIVLLVHPENVLADAKLVRDFKQLIATLDSKICQ